MSRRTLSDRDEHRVTFVNLSSGRELSSSNGRHARFPDRIANKSRRDRRVT